MRMSNTGGTPRKFSEKIAILERKQNEENSTFEDIMRQVRSITHEPSSSSSSTAPIPIQQMSSPSSLQPPQPWGNHLGGSLPNVHQLPSYEPPQWPPNWQYDNRSLMAHRSRSPESQSVSGSPHHYHPYGAYRPNRSPDRVPPLHPNYGTHHQPSSNGYNTHGHLIPPDSWSQINRARSDSAIHNMHPASNVPYEWIPGPVPSAQMPVPMKHNVSPQQSPTENPMMNPNYRYANGSPMQSPMGSPHASTMMLDNSGTPVMELSPPGMPDYSMNAKTFAKQPNGMPNGYYHPPVGPRHSTATCGPRLAPGPILTTESQSAPTSPHNQLDPNQQPAWTQRTFSNSPEALYIPKLVLTDAEGEQGQQLECYNELQVLSLDNNDLSLYCDDNNSSTSAAQSDQNLQMGMLQN
ncbi:unnamed protein product [Caenorhabditis bovis]|uniref:Transducer of regulated CREB activity N-terminal domain-containing protein n=1 Tax=Caenorhabditis bovis TaxID=2654633 RepID=A0A8S1F3P6_9PELO|nr:unnamed protein product [Caenorhabditis bovis]